MANNFTVSPMKQVINLKPGEEYQGYVLVANPSSSSSDFSFEASINPFSVSGDDYKTDFSYKSDWSRIVDWMKLEDSEGTLSPNDTMRIKYTINVPTDAPAGGQYAMIGISSKPSNESGVSDVFRVGSLIYAFVEGVTKREGHILENKIPGFVASGKPTVQVKVENNGNVHETLTTKITVKNVFTGKEEAISTEGDSIYESIIMPESTRVVSRTLENLPELGIYQVSQDVSYMGDESLISSVMILCPIWFIILVFATIISIVGMVCYGLHLKKKKKARILREKSVQDSKEDE
ncbi:hypothetical protein IJ076_01620 [Candidatus Saccharibacteria bacterium]|nr:hypothetical protein [Candidatus Saccharibacteria bacterium]